LLTNRLVQPSNAINLQIEIRGSPIGRLGEISDAVVRLDGFNAVALIDGWSRRVINLRKVEGLIALPAGVTLALSKPSRLR